jgi:uncharacterized protein (TIGR02246 family)
MSPLVRIGICLLATGLIPAFARAAAAATETPDQMIAAAKALDAEFFRAFNAGDADAVAATYWRSPEVVSYPPDTMEVRGWDAIKAGFAQAFTAMGGAKLESLDAHYLVAGEYVLSWGRWKMTLPGADGTPVTMEGRYTDVKAKRDGKWVFIQDHASAPMSPPPV